MRVSAPFRRHGPPPLRIDGTHHALAFALGSALGTLCSRDRHPYKLPNDWPVQIRQLRDSDVPDPLAAAHEHLLRIFQLRSPIESQVDPLRIDRDMNESVAGASSERGSGRDGVVGVVDQLDRAWRFVEHQGARRERDGS